MARQKNFCKRCKQSRHGTKNMCIVEKIGGWRALRNGKLKSEELWNGEGMPDSGATHDEHVRANAAYEDAFRTILDYRFISGNDLATLRNFTLEIDQLWQAAGKPLTGFIYRERGAIYEKVSTAFEKDQEAAIGNDAMKDNNANGIGEGNKKGAKKGANGKAKITAALDRFVGGGNGADEKNLSPFDSDKLKAVREEKRKNDRLWRQAGKPQSGPFFDERRRLHKILLAAWKKAKAMERDDNLYSFERQTSIDNNGIGDDADEKCAGIGEIVEKAAEKCSGGTEKNVNQLYMDKLRVLNHEKRVKEELWREEGTPRSGPLNDEHFRLKACSAARIKESKSDCDGQFTTVEEDAETKFYLGEPYNREKSQPHQYSRRQ